MEQHDYHRSIAADMAPQQAYEKIADVSGWWAKDFKGSALKNGDTFTVSFGTTWVEFKIADAEPGKKITWLVTDCHLQWLSDIKEWNNTSVEWAIKPENGGSRIDMIHHGLRPGIECWNACENGWDGHLLSSLQNLVNKG